MRLDKIFKDFCLWGDRIAEIGFQPGTNCCFGNGFITLSIILLTCISP